MANRDDFDREILDIIPERFDADADSRMARKSARNGILVTVSLGILAVMAVGVTVRHFLFGEVPRDHQLSVPVIHAEDKPIKVKPQDRGGMDVPNQDKLIYDQMAAKGPPAPPERLLPPPEQAQTPPPADQRTPSAASVNAALPPPATSAPPAKPASEPAPVAAMTASAGPAMPKGVPSPVAPTSKPQPVAKPAAPAPATPTAPAAPTAAVHGGGWVVQLGAVRSEAEAKTEWARLKNAHKEELGDLSSDIMRVDLGAKGIFWRVRGGPLDEAQARLLCAQLTKQSQGCIIARK
jgi:hypothetical protein